MEHNPTHCPACFAAIETEQRIREAIVTIFKIGSVATPIILGIATFIVLVTR